MNSVSYVYLWVLLCFFACGEGGLALPASAKATQVVVSGTSCALTESGTVRCWGTNSNGELGADTSKTTFNRVNTPVEVKGLTGATAIASGEAFNCALVSAGAVECWGFNGSGQLGNGKELVDSTALESSMTPVAVVGLSGAKALAAGDSHACVLTSSGGVKCWGEGGSGQLGDGFDLGSVSSHFSNKPVDVPGISGALWLGIRGDLSCVVTSSHSVKCWGRSTSSPEPIAGFESGIDKVFVGGARGYGPQTVCAVTSGGEAKCMGTTSAGASILGRGTDTTTDAATPVTVSGLTSGVTSMGLGDHVSCAIHAGAVKCWGENDFDQVLGVGDSPTFSSVPVALPGLSSGAVSVSVGSCNTCAIANGAAFCWGRQGCVGNGNDDYSTSETYNSPQAVKTLP